MNLPLDLFAAAAVASATPLLLAGLGELVAERAGVLNLGVEGLMALGATAGFAVALHTGSPWLGAGAGMLAGATLSLLHALPAVWLRVDQVVSGLALLFLCGGLSSALGRALVGQPGPTFAELPVPGLSAIPLLGPALFRHDALVYLTLLLVPALTLFLRRTRTGLALQLVGESPRLADASGASVAGLRIGAVAFGGACAGLAGAYLSLAETPGWVDGLVAGRGWIALALVLFAGWHPARLLLGAWLFGGLVALQFRAQAFGVALPAWLLEMAPYLLTLIVVATALRRRGPPAALGRPYVREDRNT